MTKLVVSTIAAVAMLGGAAMAQQEHESVVLEPEVQTQIRGYIEDNHPPASAAPAGTSTDVTWEVGATVPADMELYAFEGIPQAQDWQYTVVNERTYLVDPTTREVVYIMD